MPNFGQLPQTATLLGLQTITAASTTSGVSGVLSLPSASSYRLITQLQTITASSSLQVIFCTSFDNGATYNEILSTAQMTTSGLGQQLLIRPYLNPGDVATNAATASMNSAGVPFGADIGAGVVNNGPINPQFIRIRWIVGGASSPSATFQVQYAAVPQDLSD